MATSIARAKPARIDPKRNGHSSDFFRSRSISAAPLVLGLVTLVRDRVKKKKEKKKRKKERRKKSGKICIGSCSGFLKIRKMMI